jgi:hypothetical protein
MSFGNALKNFGAVEELLILALMFVSVVALFYFEISLTYKIGIAVLVFTVVILVTLANQIIRQQKEARRAAQR